MDPSQDAAHVAWVREGFDAVSRFAGAGAYLNFLGADDGEDHVRAAYGATTYARLSTLKQRFDPENVFHLNQNVRPANSEGTELFGRAREVGPVADGV